MSDVLYEERGRVAVVTLNRPEALNGFTHEMRVGIIEAFNRIAAAEHIRAVVLTGAGRGFSAGADLNALPPSGIEVAAMLENEFGPGLLAIADLPKPVIAAVNGFASGVAAGYVLASDIVLMGDKAFLQLPFAKIGLVPDGGLTWLFAQRLGPRLSFELALSGDRIPAARCVELGLANRAVPDADLFNEAFALAEKLADAAPLSVAGTKQLLRRAPSLDFAGAIRAEGELQKDCIDSQDFREGVKAFFDKRPPKFTGR
ncbi:enoyl-CoA hydratase/isomerase family protein [Steroidobacter sp.]|uniref:enoyl-CoA hydratase/isomerase family protein n=1 Tax=Steroidobacter sp. TaxID=1978227 RepID=UPI001A4D877A|nr:enoyl-CoA hydratase-related protein [Steroidobacter sp.]MBL8271516.1 enoyl-CoA hydratase/isomerase family protein [Steroidobacter sp.]